MAASIRLGVRSRKLRAHVFKGKSEAERQLELM